MSVQTAIALANQKALQEAKARALRAQEIVIDLHRTAPRDSVYRNSKGLQRSASLAAPDTNNLLDILSSPVQQVGDAFRVAMNYDVLENGRLKRQLREETKKRLKNET
jgi:hypothetical protein